MTAPRDPLFDAIHAAGEVPPPPDRDAAFARAMQPVLMPSRRRLSRSFIALFAAALRAAPAAVFAAHETHGHAADVTPIVSERPDPGGSIHPEADDATLEHQAEHGQSTEIERTASSTDDHGATTTTGTHSGESTLTSGSDDHSGSTSSGSGDGGATLSPTPTQTESSGSSSSGDGGTSSDGGGISTTSDGGSTPSSSDGGASTSH